MEPLWRTEVKERQKGDTNEVYKNDTTGGKRNHTNNVILPHVGT